MRSLYVHATEDRFVSNGALGVGIGSVGAASCVYVFVCAPSRGERTVAGSNCIANGQSAHLYLYIVCRHATEKMLATSPPKTKNRSGKKRQK